MEGNSDKIDLPFSVTTITPDLSKEQRRESRQKGDIPEIIKIEINFSFPKNLKLVRDVIDISEHGLSFNMSLDEGYFSAGTQFKDISILRRGRIEKVSGEVIYVKRVKDKSFSYYRTGICFKTRTQSMALNTQLKHKLRPLRYGSEFVTNLSRLVAFCNPDGNTTIGSILNFSKFGVAFEVDHVDTPLRISDSIPELKIVIDNQTVYIGKATIIYINYNDSKSVTVGVALQDGWLDVDKIFELKKRADIEREMTHFFSSLNSIDVVNFSFKASVADLRYFLESVKKELDSYESKIQNMDLENKRTAESHIIRASEKKIIEYLNFSLKNMANIVSDLTFEQQEAYKTYFQKHLHNLFLSSPFINRAYLKPRGYAGDYEVINMLLKNNYDGNSLFSKIISRHSYSLPVAQAHRNRITHLSDRISKFVEKKLHNQKIVKIASVGCGPSSEIIQFLSSNVMSNHCEISLIDFDPEPLYFTQEKIVEVKALNRNIARVNLINKSVRDLIKESKSSQSSINGQDLIYCAGLFDYLTLSTCSRLTKIFYDAINPQGIVIITNVADTNEYKMFMEYGLEWYLFHRSKEDMQKILKTLSEKVTYYLNFEDTETNIFLNIEKP